MSLPSAWQQHGHAFSGVFWFRRTVVIPNHWIGHDLDLHLGAADKHDITYVNGVEVGRTGTGFEEEHWNRPRRYRIPSALVIAPEITIAVRVYSFIYDGGLIGPAAEMRLACPSAPTDPPVCLAGEWHYAIEHDFGYVPFPALPGHLCPQSPHILHDNMLAPLAPFGLRGALWYQGEANTTHPARYADLLRDLVDDWRRLWGRGDFPFLVVQLPAHHAPSPHKPDSNWARLRESQLHVARTVPGVTAVITLDVGEATDIHPKNKAPVGDRLAQAALVRVHGKPGAATGPLALTAKRNGSEIRVTFDHGNANLKTRDGAPPSPVYLRDAAGAWHPGIARIEDAQLVASSAACPDPVEIAYAWADNPVEANLTNFDNHPASPFRMPACQLIAAPPNA
jgi:sialate O-acetylesterase